MDKRRCISRTPHLPNAEDHSAAMRLQFDDFAVIRRRILAGSRES
jgi:hypothetical protein